MNPGSEGQLAHRSVVLGEFSVSSAPGNERKAAERVAALVRQADVLHPFTNVAIGLGAVALTLLAWALPISAPVYPAPSSSTAARPRPRWSTAPAGARSCRCW